MLARTFLRVSGLVTNPMRAMSNVPRDRRAQIELDPFDNPYLDVET